MDVVDLRKHPQLSYDYSCEEAPNQKDYFMHTHTQMEVYLLLAGDVEYHVENHIYRPKAGDVMIMRAGEMHTSKAQPEPGGAYERYNIRFSPELLKESLNSRLLIPFLNRPGGAGNHYPASQIPSAYIQSCFQRMFSKKEDEGGSRVMSYLIPILQEIYDAWVRRESNQEKQHQMPQDSLAAKIISYINQNLFTLRGPQELTDVFFLSQSQLYRAFHEYTGTSVWDYVRKKRLISARERLQNGEKPTQAAAACGFADYSTFYRAYKRQFECSPQNDYQAGGKR